MCIGANEPGGPRRCSADAAARSARTAAASIKAAAYADALSAECTFDEAHLELLELQRKAVMGEPLTPEEQVTLHTGSPQFGPPQDPLREQYEEFARHSRQLGLDPGTYDDYVAIEHAAADANLEWHNDNADTADLAAEAAFHEWEADTASGQYLRMERADALTAAVEHAAELDIEQAQALLHERINSPEHHRLLTACDQARSIEKVAEQRWATVENSDDADALTSARSQLYDAYCARLIAEDDLAAHTTITDAYAARVRELSGTTPAEDSPPAVESPSKPHATAPTETNSASRDYTWVMEPATEDERRNNHIAVSDLAAYRGISTEQTSEMISAEIASGTKPDDAIRGLYRKYNPAADNDRRFVVVDLTTNTPSPGCSEIVNSGIVVMTSRGEITDRINELHGIDPRAARTIGTGTHHLRYDEIHGQPQFADSRSKARLQALLDDPNTTLVAHDGSRQRQFLAANGVTAPRVIDTRHLTERIDRSGGTLADFTAAHGIDHPAMNGAYNNALATARGLLGFWRDQHK